MYTSASGLQIMIVYTLTASIVDTNATTAKDCPSPWVQIRKIKKCRLKGHTYKGWQGPNITIGHCPAFLWSNRTFLSCEFLIWHNWSVPGPFLYVSKDNRETLKNKQDFSSCRLARIKNNTYFEKYCDGRLVTSSLFPFTFRRYVL